MRDLTASHNCTTFDTGSYSFQIQNDSLQFTTINDNCPDRNNVFANSNWVKIVSSIQKEEAFNRLNIYPNPARDILYIQSSSNIKNEAFAIYDQFGKEALKGTINEKITDLNISELPLGFYFLQFESGINNRIRFIKK